MSATDASSAAVPLPSVRAAARAAARPYASPYLAGVGLGLVLLASFVIAGRGLGASGAFSSVASAAVAAAAPAHAGANPAIAEYAGAGGPLGDWLVWEIAGVVLGGFASAWLAGRLGTRIERGPRIADRARLAYAFGGGAVMGVGAKLARGCTSGAGAHRRRAAERGELAVHRHGVRGGVPGGAALPEGVDMTFSLFPVDAASPRAGLAVALAVGVAFGWCLERAGLGSARRLAGQFFGTDFTVLKVMFSAIATAALGVFWLSRLGVLDAARVHVPETFFLPQAVGGAVFGVGLVAAGLCPGTSCVAAATGRRDGVAVVGGMLAGVLLFAEAFPLLEGFYGGTAAGTLTFPGLLHLSRAAVTAAVVAMALGAFAGAEAWERRAAAGGAS